MEIEIHHEIFDLGSHLPNFLSRNYKELDVWKCEFYEKWEFEIVNSVINETLNMWILWKMLFLKCEFCEKWDFRNVNFVKNEIFKM